MLASTSAQLTARRMRATPRVNTYETLDNYSMIQTFYADPDVVNKSGTVTFTSVHLFFKPLFPVPGVTGTTNPSVTVRICELTNNEPDLTKVFAGVHSTLSYNEIAPGFADGSTPVPFGFNKPLTVPTGISYGIIIRFDDPGFELWQNIAGDKLVSTNTKSPGSNLVKDGKLYLSTNAGTYRAQADADLKFTINCAQYSANTLSDTYIPGNFEFFTTSTVTGTFIGGEKVFQQVANNQVSNTDSTITFTSNTNIINAGTANFTTSGIVAGDQLAIWSNSTYRVITTVDTVLSSSSLTVQSTLPVSNATGANWMVPPVGQVYIHDKSRNLMYLMDSNANTSLKFQANSNLVYGQDSLATCTIASIDSISVDRVSLKADFTRPSTGNIKEEITFANKSGNTFLFSYGNKREIELNRTLVENLSQYDAHILSRSVEVDNTNLPQDLLFDGVYAVNRPSVVVNTTLSIAQSNAQLFTSPIIDDTVIDMYVIRNIVSNTYTTTDANSTVIDSEVAGPYLALSKHISTKTSFANNRFAEDVRMYMTAYRPVGTDIKVYARLHNSADSDAFDDKAWSPLEYVENAGKFSAKDDEGDFIEYELGLPQYSDTANVLPGTFTSTLSSNALVTITDPTSYVANGDVIKLYNPLIPEDYIVEVVSSANTTAIVLENPISNNNVVGNGFKIDRLKYYNTAFNNMTNDNVSRYYNTSLVSFDKFDSMQIKIVFLSDATYIAPKVDQIQVIGVSA